MSGDFDLGARLGVLGRVLDQVGKHLVDLDVIEEYGRQVVRDRNGDGMLLDQGPQAAEDIVHQRPYVIPPLLRT